MFVFLLLKSYNNDLFTQIVSSNQYLWTLARQNHVKCSSIEIIYLSQNKTTLKCLYTSPGAKKGSEKPINARHTVNLLHWYGKSCQSDRRIEVKTMKNISLGPRKGDRDR